MDRSYSVTYDAEVPLHDEVLRRARPDVSAALDWVRGFASTRDVLNRLDPGAAARAVGRLREMLAAHLSGNGVWFDSRAWIFTARRR